MEPISRLFYCSLCHVQVIICSYCDRGHIYCNQSCSAQARRKSLKAAGKRYQATIKGKRNHAARQARYEMKLKANLTHHSSPSAAQYAPMQELENDAEKSETDHGRLAVVCCFCNKSVSVWLRNDFLQRSNSKKTCRLQANPQAP